MPLYYFKLVDGRTVTDYGVSDLLDDTIAQVEAIKLARSVRVSQPELIGQHYSITVLSGEGAICIIPLEIP